MRTLDVIVSTTLEFLPNNIEIHAILFDLLLSLQAEGLLNAKPDQFAKVVSLFDNFDRRSMPTKDEDLGTVDQLVEQYRYLVTNKAEPDMRRDEHGIA